MTVGLSTELDHELENTQGSDLLEVVLELRPRDQGQMTQNGSRDEKIAALKESFNREVEPVEEAIRQIGGEVTGRAWINKTLRARVPARKIRELANHERVQAVDLPHAIAPDLR